jgi:hypothetical protein
MTGAGGATKWATRLSGTNPAPGPEPLREEAATAVATAPSTDLKSDNTNKSKKENNFNVFAFFFVRFVSFHFIKTFFFLSKKKLN